jgi:hypothetical protein
MHEIIPFNKNAINAPKARKGPKGILLLKENFLLGKATKRTPIKAPAQKEMAKAQIPLQKPRSHGIPRTSLASPKPIHLPFEISHREPKKAKKARPTRKLLISKIWNKFKKAKVLKI